MPFFLLVTVIGSGRLDFACGKKQQEHIRHWLLHMFLRTGYSEMMIYIYRYSTNISAKRERF